MRHAASVPRRSSIVAAALFAAAAATSRLPAQALLGTYTVDNFLPASASNFTSLVSAVAALNANGVAGPTQFHVMNNGVPYAGFALAAPPLGSGPAAPIVFLGIGKPLINTPAAGFTQAVRFGTSSATVGTGGPTDVTIEGFDVTGAPNGAGILFNACARVVVRECYVYSCGAGIHVQQTPDALIERNEINAVGTTPGAPGSSNYAGGVCAYFNSHNFVIRRNKIRDCTHVGIFIGSSGGASTPLSGVCVNNFVWNCVGANPNGFTGGIAHRRGTTTLAANTVSMPIGASAPAIHVMGAATDSPVVLFANNLARHLGTGPCVRVESTTTPLPATMNHDLYDPGANAILAQIGSTSYATMPLWRSALGGGRESASIAGASGLLSATNLHISSGSAAFDAGMTLSGVADDVDGDPRPLGGAYDIGADEAPAVGLFASFTNSTSVGVAGALTVSFFDASYSSAGPIATYAWSFGDGGTSTAANPTRLYACPGTYSVSLTVTDGAFPPATVVKPNLVVASQQTFSLTTTGGGVGDLTIVPVPTVCGAANGAVHGWSLLSATPPPAVGSGPFFGLNADALTFYFLSQPAVVGDPTHFIAAPPAYPDGGPVVFPPGTFSSLAGSTFDGAMIYLEASGLIKHWTNVSRVTF